MWHMFKDDNKDVKTKLITYGIFIVNFEQISCINLVFPLLTLNKYKPVGEMSRNLLNETPNQSN